MSLASRLPPEGWSAMASAPRTNSIILLTASGFEVHAEWATGFVDEFGEDCGMWCALAEADHPPCWTDGACWGSNVDGMPSDPPIGWRRSEEARCG
jgi:hypothetical protein